MSVSIDCLQQTCHSFDTVNWYINTYDGPTRSYYQCAKLPSQSWDSLIGGVGGVGGSLVFKLMIFIITNGCFMNCVYYYTSLQKNKRLNLYIQEFPFFRQLYIILSEIYLNFSLQ